MSVTAGGSVVGVHIAGVLCRASLIAAVVLALAPGVASATADSRLGVATWPRSEVLERCHAVVDGTAVPTYAGVTASVATEAGRVRVALRSADDFPAATFEAKLCTWHDRDGDRLIDADEESSVTAYTGPMSWPAGGRAADLLLPPGLGPGDCVRLWAYAYYPDGGWSTKRSSTACLALAPVTAVPETPHIVLLGASGLVSVFVGVLVLRRRAQRAKAATASYL